MGGLGEERKICLCTWQWVSLELHRFFSWHKPRREKGVSGDDERDSIQGPPHLNPILPPPLPTDSYQWGTSLSSSMRWASVASLLEWLLQLPQGIARALVLAAEKPCWIGLIVSYIFTYSCMCVELGLSWLAMLDSLRQASLSPPQLPICNREIIITLQVCYMDGILRHGKQFALRKPCRNVRCYCYMHFANKKEAIEKIYICAISLGSVSSIFFCDTSWKSRYSTIE